MFSIIGVDEIGTNRCLLVDIITSRDYCLCQGCLYVWFGKKLQFQASAYRTRGEPLLSMVINFTILTISLLYCRLKYIKNQVKTSLEEQEMQGQQMLRIPQVLLSILKWVKLDPHLARLIERFQIIASCQINHLRLTLC